MKKFTSLRIKHKTNYVLKGMKEHKVLISILFIILLFLYYNYIKGGILHSLVNYDMDPLISFIDSFGFFSIIAYLIIVIIEVVIGPIPSIVLYAVGGVVFGTLLGGTTALLGNIFGAIIAFKIAQKYGRKYVEKNMNKDKLMIFDKFSQKYGGYTIFFLRVNPLTSSDIFNYLAGLTKMPLKHVVLGTAFGLAPLVYAQSYMGGGFVTNNSLLYLLLIFISIVYFIVFIYAIYLKLIKAKKAEVKK